MKRKQRKSAVRDKHMKNTEKAYMKNSFDAFNYHNLKVIYEFLPGPGT